MMESHREETDRNFDL